MKDKKNGFTLIEIMIVVAIILSLSILASIKYMDIVETNNAKLDIINARVIAEGIELAAISGDINLNTNVSHASINNVKFQKYFDTSVVPKSKKYSSDTPAFTYSIDDHKIKVYANNKELYPNPE